MTDPRLDLETQELEAAINKRKNEILSRIYNRLEQRHRTGHPISLNATEVKHLWQDINTKHQYNTYLERMVRELQNTNKVLADMVNEKDTTKKRWFNRTGRSTDPHRPPSPK